MSQPPLITLNIQDLERETCGRYQFLRVLGRGSFGVVLSAIDRVTLKPVAVKRLEGILTSHLDAKRVLREIRILSMLQHENITNLIDVVSLPDFSDFRVIIVVVDLMDTDMFQIIASGQPLESQHRQYFAYQLLRGLKYIHSANVLHRDLKPSNILLNSSSELKICDFGLARVTTPETSPEFLSEYVTTRWYRAPEVLLNYEEYGSAMDVWSVGCIMAELVLRRPLFPGKGTLHQLELINSILGSPTEDDLSDLQNPKARSYIFSLPQHDSTCFEEMFNEVDPLEVDFISRMLKWDPRKRINVVESLEHPYLAEYHDPIDEPVAIPIDDFEFERPDIEIDELKMLLWEEIRKFHPDFPEQ